jgi:hypothetical protein
VVSASACGEGTRWSDGRCLAFDATPAALIPASLACGPRTHRKDGLCVRDKTTQAQNGILRVLAFDPCQLCTLQIGQDCSQVCQLQQVDFGYVDPGHLGEGTSGQSLAQVSEAPG